MATGGVLNFVRAAGASVVLAGWIVWIGFRFIEGGSAHVTTIFPVFIAAQWIAPSDFQRGRLFGNLLAASIVAWLGYVWRFGTVDYQRMVLIWIVAIFAICVVGWIFEKAHRRWKAIHNPTTRAFIATFAITTATIVGLAALLYLLPWAMKNGKTGAGWPMTGPIDWHSVFVDHWDVTVALVYLPAMALIALTFYWRRTRKKNDA